MNIVKKTKRISAGHYEFGEWTIKRIATDDYGYPWLAEHPLMGDPDKCRLFGFSKACVLKEIARHGTSGINY